MNVVETQNPDGHVGSRNPRFDKIDDEEHNLDRFSKQFDDSANKFDPNLLQRVGMTKSRLTKLRYDRKVKNTQFVIINPNAQ